MKFIVDVMLGRLATWLRLIGHDVLFDRNMDDRQLIRYAREQERTIITRDTGLARRRAVARYCIFIRSDRVIDQLAEMKQLLCSTDKPLHGRCARCNGELECVEKSDEIGDGIPDYVYHAHDRFLRCSTCAKIYWEGSHYRHMKRTLQQVLR